MLNSRFRSAGIFFLVLILASAGASSEAQDFSKMRFRAENVADNVYVLSGGGGNIGVLAGNDGVLLIDASYAQLADKLKAALATVSKRPVRFLVNTHWHQDHTGGGESFIRAGAVLVAHENARKRMGTAQFMEFFKRTVPPAPESALPIITFSRDVTFHLNGDDAYVFHVDPAHTDGDSVVHFRKANVIHVGDLFFNGAYPFIDVDAGGSIDGMIAAADRIIQICDGKTKVIPGHGPISDGTGLAAYRAMLATIRDRIAAEMREGKTLDAIVASRPTQDFDAVWGGGFMKPDLFVRIIHNSLIKARE